MVNIASREVTGVIRALGIFLNLSVPTSHRIVSGKNQFTPCIENFKSVFLWLTAKNGDEQIVGSVVVDCECGGSAAVPGDTEPPGL